MVSLWPNIHVECGFDFATYYFVLYVHPYFVLVNTTFNLSVTNYDECGQLTFFFGILFTQKSHRLLSHQMSDKTCVLTLI